MVVTTPKRWCNAVSLLLDLGVKVDGDDCVALFGRIEREVARKAKGVWSFPARPPLSGPTCRELMAELATARSRRAEGVIGLTGRRRRELSYPRDTLVISNKCTSQGGVRDGLDDDSKAVARR